MIQVLIIGLGWVLVTCLVCLLIGRLIRVADARDEQETRARVGARRTPGPLGGLAPWSPDDDGPSPSPWSPN